MSHAPDHNPAAATAEHAALIVALDAGDLAGLERDRATTLVGTCVGCACLLADLRVLRAATAGLPARPRTRDYRLTDADAGRLGPSPWRRLVGWLGAPRSSVRPLAGGLAALGIAGLLLSTTPGFFGQAAATLSTTGAPVVAPGDAGGADRGAGSNALPSSEPSTLVRLNGAAPEGPAASPAPGGPGSTPGAAALPAPSPAAVALPAPTLIPGAGTVTGPAAGATTTATAGPSGFSTDAGAATDSATKAAPPIASQAERGAAQFAASEPPPPDRTLGLVLSLALLVFGIGLFVANRTLRHRARS